MRGDSPHLGRCKGADIDRLSAGRLPSDPLGWETELLCQHQKRTCVPAPPMKGHRPEGEGECTPQAMRGIAKSLVGTGPLDAGLRGGGGSVCPALPQRGRRAGRAEVRSLGQAAEDAGRAQDAAARPLRSMGSAVNNDRVELICVPVSMTQALGSVSSFVSML